MSEGNLTSKTFLDQISRLVRAWDGSHNARDMAGALHSITEVIDAYHTSGSADEPKATEDEQAGAWMSVWNKMRERSPGFYMKGRSGEEAVLIELDRLYSLAQPPSAALAADEVVFWQCSDKECNRFCRQFDKVCWGCKKPRATETKPGSEPNTKGSFGAECNRAFCKNVPATWKHRDLHNKHYCQPCGMRINELNGEQLCSPVETEAPRCEFCKLLTVNKPGLVIECPQCGKKLSAESEGASRGS